MAQIARKEDAIRIHEKDPSQSNAKLPLAEYKNNAREFIKNQRQALNSNTKETQFLKSRSNNESQLPEKFNAPRFAQNIEPSQRTMNKSSPTFKLAKSFDQRILREKAKGVKRDFRYV